MHSPLGLLWRLKSPCSVIASKPALGVFYLVLIMTMSTIALGVFYLVPIITMPTIASNCW